MERNCKLTNVSNINSKYHGSNRRRVLVGSCIRTLKPGVCIFVSELDIKKYRYLGEVSWNPDPGSWSSNIVLLAERIAPPVKIATVVVKSVEEKKEPENISEETVEDVTPEEIIEEDTIGEPVIEGKVDEIIHDEPVIEPDITEEPVENVETLEDFKKLHSLKELHKIKIDNKFSISGYNSMTKEQKAETIYGMLGK